MNRMNIRQSATGAITLVIGLSAHLAMAGTTDARLQALTQEVDKQANQLMTSYAIPGMAIAISMDGQQHFYQYGLADVAAGKEVTRDTLFELGSISKTFTATQGSYVQHQGAFKLDDTAASFVSAWQGTPIGNATLLELATYSAGGLPLQFPNNVRTHDEMLAYYKAWQPAFAPGSHRMYSNPSIGLYGYLAALSAKADFTTLMEKTILPQLKLDNTFIKVPETKLGQYSFGYNTKGKAIRLSAGMFDAEAYGIKSSASDMLKYLEANMGLTPLSPEISAAIEETHKGRYQTTHFTQALGWEIYPYPTTLDTLLAGNSKDVITKPNPVAPATAANSQGEVFINKTGSTGGFGAYVAYVPSRKMAIVMLANKNYPIPARVEAAYRILGAVQQ